MTDAAPVVARGLVKRYGDIVAVAGVDLTVEPGDVFGYLGPNGAGKTTSLRMLLGLIRPTAGGAKLFGRDPIVDGVKALEMAVNVACGEPEAHLHAGSLRRRQEDFVQPQARQGAKRRYQFVAEQEFVSDDQLPVRVEDAHVVIAEP